MPRPISASFVRQSLFASNPCGLGLVAVCVAPARNACRAPAARRRSGDNQIVIDHSHAKFAAAQMLDFNYATQAHPHLTGLRATTVLVSCSTSPMAFTRALAPVNCSMSARLAPRAASRRCAAPFGARAAAARTRAAPLVCRASPLDKIRAALMGGAQVRGHEQAVGALTGCRAGRAAPPKACGRAGLRFCTRTTRAHAYPRMRPGGG